MPPERVGVSSADPTPFPSAYWPSAASTVDCFGEITVAVASLLSFAT